MANPTCFPGGKGGERGKGKEGKGKGEKGERGKGEGGVINKRYRLKYGNT